MSSGPAEHTGGALSETWRVLLDAHPDAWTESREGVSAWATGIPIATLNGVSCSRLDPDPEDIKSLLGELKARGLPHLLQLRPGSHPVAVASSTPGRARPASGSGSSGPTRRRFIRARQRPASRRSRSTSFASYPLG